MIKKRVAVCFSGQMRNVEHTFFNYLKPNLFDCNPEWDFDFFVHTWFSNEDVGTAYNIAGNKAQCSVTPKNAVQTVFDVYNPIKILIEKQIEFDEKDYNKNKAELIVPKYSLSKCYSIWQSSLLKIKQEEYIKKNYDAAMLLRFDLGIGQKINLNDFDLNFVNMSEHGVWRGQGVDVTHAIMSSDAFNKYATAYLNLDNYFRNDHVQFCDEKLFHRHLDCLELPFKRTNLLNSYTLVRNVPK